MTVNRAGRDTERSAELEELTTDCGPVCYQDAQYQLAEDCLRSDLARGLERSRSEVEGDLRWPTSALTNYPQQLLRITYNRA